ncbi:MAG: Cu(I)/Ag(I) efflux system membrane fusion protein [Verrucomicrobiales bacterium]|jgi:Cu(I)/Ag(I) efflux system membrane fusion protein
MKNTTKQLSLKKALLWIGLIGFGVILGLVIGGDGSAPGGHDHGESTGAATKATLWTCSMHPQIQQPKPGKCPICAMDLIPLTSGGGGTEGPRELRMSQQAKDLAGITTVPVERRYADADIRLYGKVDYDETRTKTIAAWFPARIDRLYVDFTGITVQKGDHLANIYSPDLLQAQQEFLSAIKFGRGIETSRDKLRLWGLSDEAIRRIQTGGSTSDHMDIDASSSGIVIHKNVNQGDYVKTGQPLFRIADLSTVWVQLDAYESDMPWLRFGQTVKFETEAVPGQVFEGKVSFVSPTLDPKTRTSQVRVIADNPGEVLKPEMYVRAVVTATLAGKGKVISQELMGKWISPMHPEIIKDGPGVCDVCGMKLVKAEDLGYTVIDNGGEAPLVVPSSAVLRTGTRSLVYVEVPNSDQPTYEGREILVGARAGDFYIVEEGLMEGDMVVAQGNFKIDSALQIVAKPSMMSPGGGGTGGGHQHGAHGGEQAMAGSTGDIERYDVSPEFRAQLVTLLGHYLETQTALANDQLDAASQHGGALGKALDGVDMALVQGDAHNAWMAQLAPLHDAGIKISEAKDIDVAREVFEPLTNAILSVVKSFGVASDNPLALIHCPMAFDNKGAHWLQIGEDVRNPYFGESMLQCGEVKERFSAAEKQFEVPDTFRSQLTGVIDGYLAIQKALADDDLPASQGAASGAQDHLAKVDMTVLSKDAHAVWMKLHDRLSAALQAIARAEDINKARAEFEILSSHLTDALKSFDAGKDLVIVHCPMAFDNRGARWLQEGEDVLNPYFGAQMLQCGEIERRIATSSSSPVEKDLKHEH